MSEIPPEAQCYFDGVKANDTSAVATCFTEDGLVIDVGRRIKGRTAIQSWTENEVLGGLYEIVQVRPQREGAQILLRFTPKSSSGFRSRYTFIFVRGKIRSVNLKYA
jgi:hypothetical protein